MEKEVKKSSFYWLLFVDILFVAVGLLILFFQAETVKVISYLLGASIGLIGVFGIIRFFMRKDERFFTKYGIVYGIAFLMIAFLLLWKDRVILQVLPFALGMIIIICSTLRLDDVLDFRRNHQDIWGVLFFLVLLELFFGGILTFRLFQSVFFVHQEIAVCCVFFGILDIVSNWICKLFAMDSKKPIVKDIEVSEVVSTGAIQEHVDSNKVAEEQEVIEAKKKKASTKKKSTAKKDSVSKSRGNSSKTKQNKNQQ